MATAMEGVTVTATVTATATATAAMVFEIVTSMEGATSFDGNNRDIDRRRDSDSNGNGAERSQVAVVNDIEDNKTGALGMGHKTIGGKSGKV